MCCHNQTGHLGLELKTSVGDLLSNGCHKVSQLVSPVGISETGQAALFVGAPILVGGEPKGEDTATLPTRAWKTDRLKLHI